MNAPEQLAESLVDFEELERFEQAVNNFTGGQLDAERFTAIRLQQGVYGQRQDGVHMVRVKLPGGRLNPEQLGAIATVLEQHAQHDVVHITTRQDIQIHHVPLASIPAALRTLADAGLTTREACGNTLRNMTSCPLAGVCPSEHVDVNVHLDGAVSHFLRNPLNQQLPRKFKISFSGCETDCAQGMIHDLGVVATRKDGRFGFKILAGGGLGHKPHEAIVVESFIEEKDLLLSMEALVVLHNRYSDRIKRAKARIKFLVDRFGPEGFLEKYREELAHVKAALTQQRYPMSQWREQTARDVCVAGAPRAILPQRQEGLVVFPVSVQQGDLTVAVMRGLTSLMRDFGLTDLRVTQDQNLMLVNVPAGQVASLRGALANLGLMEPTTGDDVVACPGTSTCRLGITSSKALGAKLSGGPADLRIRVSGCHNGCAQPETGDIGIYGEGKRLHGKLVPHYQMYFGGDGHSGMGLAIKGPSVPAVRIEQAVQRVQDTYLAARAPGESFYHWRKQHDKAYFEQLLADLTAVTPEQVSGLLRDHGFNSDFKVLQLGGGECAGAMQVQVGSIFYEAAHERTYRDAFVFQRKYSEAHACGAEIAKLLGQALLQLRQLPKAETLAELVAAINQGFPKAIASKFAELAAAFAAQVEDIEPAAQATLFAGLDAFTLQAADFCLALDSQLDLAGALPKASQPGAQVIQFHPGAQSATA